MHSSKLINILKLFSLHELKLFEKFIASPYFRTGRDVRDLFSVIKKAYPDFTSPEINRNIVYKKLFKENEFNERKLKNLMAALTVMAEKFLIHNYIDNDHSGKNIVLADIFYRRGNEKLFLNAINHNNLDSIQNYLTEQEAFNLKYKVIRLREKYFISKNKFIEAIPLRLEYTENSLLYHYITLFKRLKDRIIFPIFYNTPFENILFDSAIESTDFDSLLESLKLKNYSMLWLLEIYYNIYKSILLHDDETSEKYYFKLKELFLNNINIFSDGEKCYIFDSMATYCMMRDPINSFFTKECFGVYKKMLEENAYKYNENEHISTTLYGNIVFWAYDVNEFEWLEQFINKYSIELKEEHREDMKNLAKAHLYFGKGEYSESLKYINLVQNEFLLYKIQVRNLKFKLYYELNLIEEAYTLLDSFKHFLKNNSEINVLFKERATDFISIYIKLLRKRSDNKFIDYDNLKSKIEKMQGYELRPWLLNKLDELYVSTK